jgi:nucleoside-diphosphate-sugar epimerase
MRVLITGATGLVGRALCARLAEAGYSVRAALRTDRDLPAAIGEKIVVGSISRSTDWRRALEHVDMVVHAAARTHVVSARLARECMETNVHGTEALTRAAARAGVRRLVYLSSIKVNGEQTDDGQKFTVADAPRPRGLYALTKWQGEQRAHAAAEGSSLALSIIRLPLVYGPGVTANFLRLMRWVERQRPLPFAAVHNARSLVSVWNASDLIARLLEHPAGTGVWMVSDDRDLSTPELLRLMGHALGRPARLVSVPVGLLRAAGAALGFGAQMARLCGSLAVDISPARERLGWRPHLTVEDALARTADWFRHRRSSPA